jgi:hypothetical protein
MPAPVRFFLGAQDQPIGVPKPPCNRTIMVKAMLIRFDPVIELLRFT